MCVVHICSSELCHTLRVKVTSEDWINWYTEVITSKIDVRLCKTAKEVCKECICYPLKSDLCGTSWAASSQVVTEEYVSICIVQYATRVSLFAVLRTRFITVCKTKRSSLSLG
jgi:hypothetical protein